MKKTFVKLDSKKFGRNQNKNVKNITVTSQTPKSFINSSNIIIDYYEPNSLDWSDSKSIYNHLISYINLMIIDLSKDKEKLCKYLKDIFYAIFKISQEIKNVNQNTEGNNKNNEDNNNNDIKKEEWGFLTGEQFMRKNNNDLLEQLLKEETKNTKSFLTQKTESNKNIFKKSPFKIKIDRLQRKFKEKEKQFNIDKLSYLFRINEQNHLIKKLENEIHDKIMNHMPPEDLNKIKCYPDYSFIKENNLKLKNSINNNMKKSEDNKNNGGNLLNSMNFLNIINDNNNKENHKLNLKKVFSRNLSLLKNGEKLEKMRMMRFANFSFNDTKINVEKIKYYKL